MAQHAAEIVARERFTLGETWAAFLALLDESRIAAAENSFREMLEASDLARNEFVFVRS